MLMKWFYTQKVGMGSILTICQKLLIAKMISIKIFFNLLWDFIRVIVQVYLSMKEPKMGLRSGIFPNFFLDLIPSTISPTGLYPFHLWYESKISCTLHFSTKITKFFKEIIFERKIVFQETISYERN